MKLGFIILAHHQPDTVRRLVDILAGDVHSVVVHFDKGAPPEQHAEVRTLEAAYPGRVKVISKVHCVWGEWSLVEAVLMALHEFRRMDGTPDYIHLMSGADFPIRPIADFEEFLRRNPNRDFIECCDITQRRWVKGGLSMERFRFYFPVNFRTSRRTFDRIVRWHRKLKIRRKIPLRMTPHMGSQWWTLRWQTCETILDFLKQNPKVIRYFRSTWIPDESFFQTVLAHLIPRQEIADLQLMLHHLTATGRPYVVYPDHLPKVRKLPHFFIRKVAPATLPALENLVATRRSPIPKPGQLALVRDRVRGTIDSSYLLNAIVPGHPHGPPPVREIPRMLVFLTMSDAETALIRAYAETSPGTCWIGCPFAAGGIKLTDEMQQATGLTPQMTQVREKFTDQFVDALAAALPRGLVSVCVLQFGDLGEDSWSMTRINGSVFLSAHLQLLPHWLPSARVLPLPERRFRTTIGSFSNQKPAKNAPSWDIHCFAHAGNYYLLDATIRHAEEPPDSLALILPSLRNPVETRSFFTRQETEETQRVVLVIWIDDGAFLGISPPTPGYLISHMPQEPHAAPHPLYQAGDLTVAQLLSTLQSLGMPEAWSCRQVLEVVAQAPANERFGFFQQAIAYWPAGSEVELRAQLALQGGPSHDFFEMAVLADQDVPTGKLIEMAEASAPGDAAWDAVSTSIRALASRDLVAARQLALRAIQSQEVSALALIEAVQPCLPRDSRWWPLAMGKDSGLGAEQKSDAFNAIGAAASHAGDPLLAELCFVVARKINPESQASAWNLGLLRAGQGSDKEAAEAFSQVHRHYSDQSLCTAWPMLGGQAWPAVPWPSEGFSLPEGASQWPRITVVTPSYNQADYLEETILSVLRQNYPNLQYIVVDGNSDDGSKDILERYRDRIDHLIIEPDDGQTQAINKGLKLADGELVAWLNSDDVYGPGALHQVALRYLSSGADVVAGICAEHRNHSLRVINRPSASNLEFNRAELARIFPNWFAGKFFFQPEVFFTRKLIERVGPLDESLFFTMDYDLWMRFAEAGAKLEVLPWPVAFFRLHDAQKTSRSADCITEQCEVRERYHTIRLGEQRACQIARLLAPLAQEGAKVVVAGPSFEDRLETIADAVVDQVSLIVAAEPSPEDLDGAAAVIVLIGSARDELPLLAKLRAEHPELLVAGWFLDTRNDPQANFDAALRVDVIIPGDPVADDYLRHDAAVMAQAVATGDSLPIAECIRVLRAIDVAHLSC